MSRDKSAVTTQSPPVGRDLVAVPAKPHTAPTPMMRFGAVREPENAGLALAPFHQAEVGGRKQISSGFRHGPENRLGGIFSSDCFNLQRGRLIPNKPRMTMGVSQESVKERRVSPLSKLSFFDKRANILAQLSCRIHKEDPRCARPTLGGRKSSQLEPTDYVLVTLKIIHQLSIYSHSSV